MTFLFKGSLPSTDCNIPLGSACSHPFPVYQPRGSSCLFPNIRIHSFSKTHISLSYTSDTQPSADSGMPREGASKEKTKSTYSKNVSQLKHWLDFPGTRGQMNENIVNFFPEFLPTKNPNNFHFEIALQAAFTHVPFCPGVQIQPI